jgi:hypothetical protein
MLIRFASNFQSNIFYAISMYWSINSGQMCNSVMCGHVDLPSTTLPHLDTISPDVRVGISWCSDMHESVGCWQLANVQVEAWQ